MRNDAIIKDFDWVSFFLYLAILIMGVLHIYSAEFTTLNDESIFSLNFYSGKQILFILLGLGIGVIIMLLDFKIYYSLGYVFYGVAIAMLILTLLIGKTINGATAWISLGGGINLMPAEFTKVAIGLGLAKYFEENLEFKIGLNNNTFKMLLFLFLPAGIILLQNETGTVLVFFSLVILFYREGLHFMIPLMGITIGGLFGLTIGFSIYEVSLWPIYIGVTVLALVITFFVMKSKGLLVMMIMIWGLCIGVVFFANKGFSLLQKHQKNRIVTLFDPYKDKRGTGWQVIRAMTGISAGGFEGKGYLKGDITQGEFIPEQHTDMIFTTIAEERGFLGASFLIVLYAGFLIRLIYVAERQKSIFVRVFGYSLVSFLFFHFTINVGMTMNLFPIIGIPLPLVSYGGSSLWAFSIMVFVFLKLDMHRSQILSR